MRTIILQETPSEGWTIMEDGVIVNHLGMDELLWCVICAIKDENAQWPYGGGKTLDSAELEGYKKGVLDARTGKVPSDKDPDEELPF